MTSQDNSLALTQPFQLTKKIYRDPYEYILPENNSQKSKIILITGGGSGIGAVEIPMSLKKKKKQKTDFSRLLPMCGFVQAPRVLSLLVDVKKGSRRRPDP